MDENVYPRPSHELSQKREALAPKTEESEAIRYQMEESDAPPPAPPPPPTQTTTTTTTPTPIPQPPAAPQGTTP